MSNILRVSTRTGNFTIIANEPLNDQNLSWKAKGLLVYLLSKPDNWKVQPEQLRKASLDGRDAVYSTIKELIKAGYIIRRQLRDGKGRATGFEYIVTETKTTFPDNPIAELPFTENPEMVKPDISKDCILTNTESLPNTEEAGQAPKPPTAEEIIDKKQREFLNNLIAWIKVNPGKFPKKMFVGFAKYWTEANMKTKKIRRDEQKFFQMGKRLQTWFEKTNDQELSKMWELDKELDLVKELQSLLQP